jgi:hypothetical protein
MINGTTVIHTNYMVAHSRDTIPQIADSPCRGWEWLLFTVPYSILDSWITLWLMVAAHLVRIWPLRTEVVLWWILYLKLMINHKKCYKTALKKKKLRMYHKISVTCTPFSLPTLFSLSFKKCLNVTCIHSSLQFEMMSAL